MKRNKHITINLSEDQYNKLQFIAVKQSRNNSDAAYLLLIEQINKLLLKYASIENCEFIPLEYRSE